MLEYCGKKSLEYAKETDNAEIIFMVQQQMRFLSHSVKLIGYLILELIDPKYMVLVLLFY